MQQYVPYQVPEDVDAGIVEHQKRIAAQRGVPLTKVKKSGEVLRYVLALAAAAESHGIRPAAQQTPQTEA